MSQRAEPLPPLLQQPAGRALWSLAGPMVLLGILRSGYFLTDAWWVGRLGTEALAAMGAVSFGSWMVHGASLLAAAGIHSLVARALGAGTPQHVRRIVEQGLAVGMTAGACLVLGAPWLVARYLELVGVERLDGAEAALAGAYFLPLLLGAPVAIAREVLSRSFQGLGDTRLPLYAYGATLILNAALDPLLIFGVGPLPRLGIAGASIATVLSNVAGVAWLAWALRRRLQGLRPEPGATPTPAVSTQRAKGTRAGEQGSSPADLGRAFGTAGPAAPERFSLSLQILRIGTPAAAQALGFSAIYVFLADLLSRFGSAPLAALGVGHRLEGLTWSVCMGFSVACSTLVGQALGARRSDLARLRVRAAMTQLSGLMLLFSVAYMALGPFAFAQLMQDDPAAAASGAVYLRWQALATVFMAWEIGYTGAFSGAGHTVPPLLINVPLTAARIPLAWWCGQRMGVEGVWLAIAGSTILKGLVMRLWFHLTDLKSREGGVG